MPKTAATLIFRKHLFLFQQAFKQQCVLFNSSTYRKMKFFTLIFYIVIDNDN